MSLVLGQQNRNIEIRVSYIGFKGWSEWQWVTASALQDEYQSDNELFKTLFILLGSFLLLVIWALIVTLTVLCKKNPEQDKSNENEDLDDDDEEEDTKIMEEKSTSPDIKSQLSS